MPRYDEQFFHDRSGSRRSADVVVPQILDLIEPRSVVDVGCGTGTWLAAFLEQGVEDVLGIDGDYVPLDKLEIPQDRFVEANLEQPLELGRRFDLAVSLEVGEHLPETAAAAFVDSLVRLSNLVLFSAAIPDQYGTHHINEQWQDWWADRFEHHGYVAVDALRPRLWRDDRVEWWYIQNTLLYVDPVELERRPRLEELHARTARDQLALVHPRGYLSFRKLPLLTRLRARGRAR